jgi:phage replication initiation protein
MDKKTDVQGDSNTPVQNTSTGGLRACLDWFQATFRGITNPLEVVTLLGMKESDFVVVDSGKYGYNFQMRCGYIAVYFSDKLPSVHLEITGQGCREYEAKKLYDWTTLMGLFLMLDINITRLDLAIDDFKGYFTIAGIHSKLKRKHARSIFKNFRFMEKQNISTGENHGKTVYLGSVKSDLMVRFYDKYKERLSKGYEIKDGITFWNRTELQLRRKRALAAATLIAEESFEIGNLAQGILKNYITFVNLTYMENGELDKNKSRWNTSPFWLDFLGAVRKIKLTQVAPDQTIEKLKSWFDVSMVSTLAVLMEAFDNDKEMLEEWLKSGKERYADKHKLMLDKFRVEMDRKKAVDDLKRVVIKEKLLQPRRLKLAEEIVKETVYYEDHEFDKELFDRLKDTYNFKIKKDIANEDNT